MASKSSYVQLSRQARSCQTDCVVPLACVRMTVLDAFSLGIPRIVFRDVVLRGQPELCLQHLVSLSGQGDDGDDSDGEGHEASRPASDEQDEEAGPSVQQRRLSPLETAGALSRALFLWLDPLLDIGPPLTLACVTAGVSLLPSHATFVPRLLQVLAAAAL